MARGPPRCRGALPHRLEARSAEGRLLGDWKSVGEGVCELRIDHGPGCRVYYAQDGKQLVLLLYGGNKRTQAKDIERAYEYWKDYKARKPKPAFPRSGLPQKRGRGRRVH